MNAKLKELKLAALTQFAANHGLKLTHLGDLDPKSQEEVDALFAELMVAECVAQCKNHDPCPDEWSELCEFTERRIVNKCIASIKEHFGVE